MTAGARSSGVILALIIATASAEHALTNESEVTLRQHVASASLSDLRWPDFPDYRSEVGNLYGAVNYTPVWVKDRRVTKQAFKVIEELRSADAKGLNPEDYDGPRWISRIEGLKTNETITRFDLALTVSVMRYISDLHIGRVNPRSCHFAFDIEHKKFSLASFVAERLINGESIREALDRVEPPFPGYGRLQKALLQYTALAQADDGELLPATKKPVEAGDSYAGCARLTRLLIRLGDLGADVSVPASGIYEEPLVEAVKRFQLRHGLDPDGRIGKSTLEQLNTPLNRRVRQLQLTLERWRWAPHEFSRPPIVVNIPEFRLRAFDDAYRSELEMNVVVGRAYKTRTPVFANDLRHVIFRPYWNVPRSIERGEFVPKIERDRAYLAKNGYEVVDRAGKVVAAAGAVDDGTLRSLRSGNLAIRQPPGPKNALGLVKFLFPNEYSVYMHDTPATQLFSRSRRDFSHGCIRVQQPEDLAVWVLRDIPRWTRERIREAMNGSETIQVNLPNPIPVLIVYGTAVAPESGGVRFLADIYGHDAALEKLLAKGYPYSE